MENKISDQILSCYVIMPFSDTNSLDKEDWEFIFKDWIKKAVESFPGADIKCSRSQVEPGNFVNDIIKELKSSDIVIADLTGRKPNVCYELGVRHSLSNGNIVITQERNDFPADLRSYCYLIYDFPEKPSALESKYIKFQEQLHTQIKAIINRKFSSDNPVSDYLEIEKSFLNKGITFTKTISQNMFAKLLEMSPEDYKGLEIAISYYKDEFPWIYEYSKGLVQMLNSNNPNIEKANMVNDFLNKLKITFKNKDLKDFYDTDENFKQNFSLNYFLLKYFLKITIQQLNQDNNTTPNSTYSSMAALEYINKIKNRLKGSQHD